LLEKTSKYKAEESEETMNKSEKLMIYTGPSMNPILKDGDGLHLISYQGRKIRPGDVIVFFSPEKDRKITHRVISINGQGIRTQGDNNRRVDPGILKPEHILGRVVYAQRRNRMIRIYGGVMGQFYALLIREMHIIDSWISSLLRPIYSRLAKSLIFKRCPPIQKRIRIISYVRSGGTEQQLLLGSQVIGQLLPRKDRWQIKRPFRLFIDEKSLPKGNLQYPNHSKPKAGQSNKKTYEDNKENFGLAEKIRNLHQELTLCGDPRNALLDLPNEFLKYIFSLLRNEPINPPKASMKQWSELFDLLKSHWILPLFYKQLGSWPLKFRPPKEIVHQMRISFLISRARALQMEKQLSKIINALHNEAVRILVLKGPALALTIYPDPAMRASSDLDLLVLPWQMAKTRETLVRLGYNCLGKRFEHSKDFYCEETFAHKSNSQYHRSVELHWDLHSFSGINRDAAVEELFERAVRIERSALKFETLNPVDSLIHRAINMCLWHNKEIRLIWIYDTALLAHQLKTQQDWEDLLEASGRWRARLALENSLKMAQVWVGLKLPHRFNDFSKWPKPTQAEISAWSDALLRHEKASSFFKLHWSSSTDIFQKARFLFHLLFPHPEIIRKYYPAAKKCSLPFTYIRRLYKWIRQLIVNPIFSPNSKGKL
jgi:signal peptidase